MAALPDMGEEGDKSFILPVEIRPIWLLMDICHNLCRNLRTLRGNHSTSPSPRTRLFSANNAENMVADLRKDAENLLACRELRPKHFRKGAVAEACTRRAVEMLAVWRRTQSWGARGSTSRPGRDADGSQTALSRAPGDPLDRRLSFLPVKPPAPVSFDPARVLIF